MIKKIIVTLVITFGYMNNVFVSDEQIQRNKEFEKHEALKEEFNLEMFMSLPPDPQNVVLEWLKPDRSEFIKQFNHYNFYRLQELLVSDFFYTHAKKYNEKLKEKKGDTSFFIFQESSQLSNITIYDRTLCQRAALFNDLKLLSILVKTGTDLNDPLHRPLSTALSCRFGESALILLSGGAKAENEDLLLLSKWSYDHLRESKIPTDEITKRAHDESVYKQLYACDIAEKLIKAGADVNGLSHYGDTPLHYAVKENNASLVVLLLENGAQVNIKNNLNLKPLHWAPPHSNIKSFLLCAQSQQQAVRLSKQVQGCCSIS